MSKKETPSNQPQKIVLCPNGCGTELVTRKFVGVFDENMKPQLEDAYENLYCTKCHIRWIPEPHSAILDLLGSPSGDHAETETKENKQAIEFETVTLKVPKNVLGYFRVMAKLDNETLEEALCYELVDDCASKMEGITPGVMMALFNAKKEFAEVLKEPQFLETAN